MSSPLELDFNDKKDRYLVTATLTNIRYHAICE